MAFFNASDATCHASNMQNSGANARPSTKVSEDILSIGGDVKAEVCVFNGELRVDLRQWHPDGYRVKRGLSMGVYVWGGLSPTRTK